MAHQNFILLATAHDSETALLRYTVTLHSHNKTSLKRIIMDFFRTKFFFGLALVGVSFKDRVRVSFLSIEQWQFYESQVEMD